MVGPGSKGLMEFDELFLASLDDLISLKGETRSSLGSHSNRGVLQVDPVVVLEIRVECQPDQSHLSPAGYFELANQCGFPLFGIQYPKLSIQFDKKDSPVWSDRQFHGLVELLKQGDRSQPAGIKRIGIEVNKR